jgi:hypothetical protein
MIFVFLLSLHVFLMLCYVILIETKKSRLNYEHWLFALLIPFVGELCLLVADIGRSPASNSTVTPFKKFKKDILNDRTFLENREFDAETISRQQLLEVIQNRPFNFELILKESLNSKDIEVVHIAASTIMKLQREYENDLRNAAEEYKTAPNNMGKLKIYIETIEKYYSKKLLVGTAALSLLEEQRELIERYLKVLPEDKKICKLSIKNHLVQNEYDAALQEAESLRYRYFDDIDIWELSINVCIESNNQEKLKEIIEDSSKTGCFWSNEQRFRWNAIKSRLKI